MSFDRAKKHLEKFGLDKNVMEFSTSSATVEEAARLLHCTEGEIAKTLSFLVDEKAILVVVAGDRKIDNHKFKEEFHKKAKMIPRDILEDLVGHQAGGVCPFGICDVVMVYLDQSLQKYHIRYRSYIRKCDIFLVSFYHRSSNIPYFEMLQKMI